MKNNIEELYHKAHFYSKELWGIQYDLPIQINSQYKKVMGSITYAEKERKTPLVISLAKYLFTEGYNEIIVDYVLLHELCHWYCSIMGKNSNDKSTEFNNELKRIGLDVSDNIERLNSKYKKIKLNVQKGA